MNHSAREEQWAVWMRAAVNGDVQAYHRFLSAVTPHLRAMARRRCEQFGAPVSEAEDVVQEVLLTIHLKRGTWDASRPIGPWISTIVRNKLIDGLRRRGRHTSVPIDDVIDILEAEHDRAVGVLDLAGRFAEFDIRVGRLTGLRKATFDAHGPNPRSLARP